VHVVGGLSLEPARYARFCDSEHRVSVLCWRVMYVHASMLSASAVRRSGLCVSPFLPSGSRLDSIACCWRWAGHHGVAVAGVCVGCWCVDVG